MPTRSSRASTAVVTKASQRGKRAATAKDSQRPVKGSPVKRAAATAGRSKAQTTAKATKEVKPKDEEDTGSEGAASVHTTTTVDASSVPPSPNDSDASVLVPSKHQHVQAKLTSGAKPKALPVDTMRARRRAKSTPDHKRRMVASSSESVEADDDSDEDYIKPVAKKAKATTHQRTMAATTRPARRGAVVAVPTQQASPQSDTSLRRSPRRFKVGSDDESAVDWRIDSVKDY